MNSFLAPVNGYCTKLAQRLERSHSRQQLLKKNERLLADMGISRELLLEGVRAWPWHLPQDDGIQYHRLRRRLVPARRSNASNAHGDTAPQVRNLGHGAVDRRERYRPGATDTHKNAA